MGLQARQSRRPCLLYTSIGELPPEIRAPQIGMTVRRGAVHRQGVEAERRQRRHQLLAGERLMNGIPRSGMGQTKVEDFAGRQTGAAAPQGCLLYTS